MFRSQFVLTSTILFSFLFTVPLVDATEGQKSLVSVNRKNITDGDLAFFYLSRNIPVERQQQLRKQSIEVLIDRQLMSDFLTKRKATVSSKDIDAYTKKIHHLIRKQGNDPDEILKKMGLTPERLKQEISLPLKWGQQARWMITDESLRKYFKKHKNKFDGTTIHAKHIILKLKKDATESEQQEATQKLVDLRKKIDANELSFSAAAKQHSESPSGKEGGDVGLISYQGQMPASFCKVAFQLKENEISQPVRTPFGMHLIIVTEIKKGDFSLEDVRAIVYNKLAGELWDGLVKQQRKTATIKWHEE